MGSWVKRANESFPCKTRQMPLMFFQPQLQDHSHQRALRLKENIVSNAVASLGNTPKEYHSFMSASLSREGGYLVAIRRNLYFLV